MEYRQGFRAPYATLPKVFAGPYHGVGWGIDATHTGERGYVDMSEMYNWMLFVSGFIWSQFGGMDWIPTFDMTYLYSPVPIQGFNGTISVPRFDAESGS